eukprot:TRINITY_DN9560_c0_g1_i2.p1 TRINITY_DN9560_c0_g1~~TRINITY_DN9560_c0_g1_i2.p1  ORF type:complete len:541 (+),score=143.04 TRINITY_DN9560_c0_g1_i2:242-1864(+)
MGFLADGEAMKWAEASKHADYIRKHGIKQFLHLYRRLKSRCNDTFLWGDEVEYIVCKKDEDKKQVRLKLNAHEMLGELERLSTEAQDECGRPQAHFLPEYGGFMLEATPGGPYGCTRDHYLSVESNMKFRREVVESILAKDERIYSLTAFPMMGAGEFTEPVFPPTGPIAMSSFLPDQVINPHTRFGTLTANIRERRGSKVQILAPLFQDTNTNMSEEPSHEGHIELDAMGFGMGCGCVQCTFQCCNINEARMLYDQLAVLCPPLLALSAATPILRGHLVDTSCRWYVISGSVDDRTEEERGLKPLENSRYVIPKSRYASISRYISTSPELIDEEYNDIDLVYDEDIYKELVENDVDERLAKHIAHLFIRDPLVIYSGRLELDDTKQTDHFENIQSTNWQSVRFKPPPPGSSIGWRVEFRVLEAQLTDFENAAFAVFVVLLTRVIAAFQLNFYMPLSQVDENMKRAQKRESVKEEKFLFRTSPLSESEAEYREMTVDEIMNGKDDVRSLLSALRVIYVLCFVFYPLAVLCSWFLWCLQCA